MNHAKFILKYNDLNELECGVANGLILPTGGATYHRESLVPNGRQCLGQMNKFLSIDHILLSLYSKANNSRL